MSKLTPLEALSLVSVTFIVQYINLAILVLLIYDICKTLIFKTVILLTGQVVITLDKEVSYSTLLLTRITDYITISSNTFG